MHSTTAAGTDKSVRWRCSFRNTSLWLPALETPRQQGQEQDRTTKICTTATETVNLFDEIQLLVIPPLSKAGGELTTSARKISPFDESPFKTGLEVGNTTAAGRLCNCVMKQSAAAGRLHRSMKTLSWALGNQATKPSIA
jgi:hypothetical protein